MQDLPKLLKKSVIAKTRIFTIEAIDLEFSNGNKVQFERLANKGHGAVLLVPLLDEHTLLLVREYAAGVERYELGFPRGSIDAGETVLQAANRELMEEVGYSARSLQVIKKLSTSPSYNQHVMHVVVASGLEECHLEGDEPEPLEVVPWPLADINSLIYREDVTDPRCLTALFMIRDKLPRK